MLVAYKRKRGRRAIARVLLRVTDVPCPVADLPGGDCWIWTGATTKGYGVIRVDDRLRYTHHIAYEAFIGPIPEGTEDFDHRCKTPACCNPWHVRPGTHRENMLTTKSATLTHCRRNHDRAAFGTHSNGRCAACAREDSRAYKVRMRSKK